MKLSWKKPIWRPYYLALDTCTSDVDADITASSSSIGTVHLHEGVANVRLRLLAHQGREVASDAEPWPVVSIRGLSWNVSLENPTIVNSPAAPAILSSESSRYPGEGNSGLRIAGGYVAGLVQGAAVAHLGKTAEPLIQGLQAEDAQANVQQQQIRQVGDTEHQHESRRLAGAARTTLESEGLVQEIRNHQPAGVSDGVAQVVA